VVAGQKIEFSDYLQAVKTQCRLLVAAVSGLPRRAKEVESLDSYLSQQPTTDTAEDEEVAS
jgi:hypothetical protein